MRSAGDCRRGLGQSGSVLAGVLAICVVMIVAGLGYLQVAASVAKNELAALEHDKALLAAESGAMLAARWLRTRNPFPESGTFTPFSTPLETTVNGLDVNVEIVASTNLGVTTVGISSEAHLGQGEPAQTFRKRIRWNTRQATFSQYAHFYHTADPTWNGFGKRTFEGRFHMNRPIQIYNVSNAVSHFRNGIVTVGPNDPYNGGFGTGGAPNFNNYDWGVFDYNSGNPSGATAAQLDQIFEDRFLSNQEEIVIPQDLTDLADGDLAGTTEYPVEVLPASLSWGITNDGAPGGDVAENANGGRYRPTLEFKIVGGEPKAIYHYSQAVGVPSTDTFSYSGGKVFLCETDLNVLGTVEGQVTVGTAPEKSICVVGDLVYSDFIPGTENAGVPSASENCLGLVSGKHVVYPKYWRKQWDMSGPEKVHVGHGGIEDGLLYVNAAIIAVENDAAEYWNHGESHNRNGNPSGHNYYYNLRFTGNHIVYKWRQAKLNVDCEYHHDARLIAGTSPPGFPNVHAVGGLWVLSLYGWAEEDAYN